MVSKIDWIKELVDTENRSDTTGVIDNYPSDSDAQLQIETISFLKEIKESLIDYSSAFNHLRGLSEGGVKIYGIANTVADFMLFRNGYKLLFSVTNPGEISIRLNQHKPTIDINNSFQQDISNEYLYAKYGAFGEIVWTHREQLVKLEYLSRHFLTLFIKHSKH